MEIIHKITTAIKWFFVGLIIALAVYGFRGDFGGSIALFLQSTLIGSLAYWIYSELYKRKSSHSLMGDEP